MKCVVVGCGGIGRAHARALQKLGVEIAAGVDLHAPTLDSFCESFGTKGFGSVEACIAKLGGSLDFATIASTPAAHYPLAKELLLADVPVMVEKPLSMNVAEANELAQLATERGLHLGVGFKMRFEPIFLKARELVGRLGPLRGVTSFKLQPRPKKPVNDWIPDVGAMYELSVHEFDLIHWICGIKPRRVIAKLEYPSGWLRESAFAAIVEYNGDVLGNLAGRFTDESTFLYRDLTIIISGERGYMRIERPDRIDLHVDGYTSIKIENTVDAFVAEFRAFTDSLRSHPSGLLSADGYAGVWTTALTEAAVLSDRRAAPVEIVERADGGAELSVGRIDDHLSSIG